MASLYDLRSEYTTLMAMMGDPEVDDDVLRDTMEAVGGELEIKAENYAIILRNLDADVAAIDEEIKRLQQRKAGYKHNIDRMKAALQEAMVQTGKLKFKTTLFSFNIQKNPPGVVMDTDDWSKVPEDFLTYKSPEINKAALKKALQAGEDLEGICHLAQSESLRIR